MARRPRSRDAHPHHEAAPATPPRVALEPLPWTSREWKIVAFLIALGILVFGQVASHAFLNYDDGQFIYENDAVKNGLSVNSVMWALTSANIGWYPTTWLTHMADVSLWGLRANCHLLMQLLLHLVTTVLLFIAFYRMTRAPIRSAFVAALFAIHPMHVESVAWVSERKDTLSTLFAALALVAYARGARAGVTRDRMLVAVAMALSLMSKQMYITLPFVLILLDYWPLDRIARDARAAGAIVPFVREKIVLFVLTFIGCFAAIVGQRNMKAVQSVDVLPLTQRVANALVAYVRYLFKLLWPTDLAVIYPLAPIGVGAALGAFIVLAAITFLVVRYRERAPYLPVGWFWYLGTLVPVIGIVQIGPQAMADRYSYFPYIGLFVMLVWGAADLAERFAVPQRVLAGAGVAVVALLACVAWRQTGYWATSESLFTHTLAVTRDNPLAEYSLGQALQLSKPDEAIPHLRRSMELTDASIARNPASSRPDWYPQAYVAIGTSYLMKARNAADSGQKAQFITDGETAFRKALELDPEAPHAQPNLDLAAKMRAQLTQGQTTAAQQYDEALNNGTALSQQHRYDEAIAEFRKAVAIAPQSPAAHIYLALGLAKAQRNAEAASELKEAQRIDAAKSNDYITRALRIPAAPDNLQRLIVQLGG